MRVGILGSGLMGAKLGTIWARARHEVVFSYADVFESRLS
jgi:predicted dinucleotide-binding enzyme